MKCKGFWVAVIVLGAGSLLTLVTYAVYPEYLGKGFDAFKACFEGYSSSGVFSMFMGALCASIISTDFKFRDIQCAIAQGYSRMKILLSKIIVYITAIWAVMLFNMLVQVIGASIIVGFGRELDGETAAYMLRAILSMAFMSAMLYMTCVFLSFAILSKAGAMTLDILVFLILSLVFSLGSALVDYVTKTDTLENIIKYLPFFSISNVGAFNISNSQYGGYMLVGLIYGAVMFGLTWLVFRKRNLS
jgi:ABC-2 type transport system permease protein